MKDNVLTRRTRGTYGGNRSDYVGDKSAWTADMQTVKLVLNAAASEDAHLLTVDISNFYLNSTLSRPEYMWLDRKHLSPTMLARYADSIVWCGDRCMVQIDRGIYGLPQAGKLAREQLVKHMNSHGYVQTATTRSIVMPRYLEASQSSVMV
jgi:hypothetical protein